MSYTTTNNDEGLPYADNRWHYITARRVGKTASVVIDEYWKGLQPVLKQLGISLEKSTFSPKLDDEIPKLKICEY